MGFWVSYSDTKKLLDIHFQLQIHGSGLFSITYCNQRSSLATEASDPCPNSTCKITANISICIKVFHEYFVDYVSLGCTYSLPTFHILFQADLLLSNTKQQMMPVCHRMKDFIYGSSYAEYIVLQR